METLILYRFVIVLVVALIGFFLAITGREMLAGMEWQDPSLDMDECAEGS
jgi:hypothetical protein